MMKVLLVGGTGFLGINLAIGLTRLGCRVTAMGTRSLPPDALAALPDWHLVSSRLSDIPCFATVLEKYRPDLVIHLASTTNPGSSEADFYAEQDRINTPTKKLIDLLAQRNTPFVYFSSGGTVYGQSKEENIDEDHPCRPVSLYGQSKIEIESYIRFSTRNRGLKHLIIRPSNPYGKFQSLDGRQGLVSTIFGKLMRNEILEVWGSGDAIRDYIYIDDLVESTCKLVTLGSWNHTLNIGSGVGHSLVEVVGLVERATGLNCETVLKPGRGADVDRVVLNVTRLAGLISRHARPLCVGISDYARRLGIEDGKTASTRDTNLWPK